MNVNFILHLSDILFAIIISPSSTMSSAANYCCYLLCGVECDSRLQCSSCHKPACEDHYVVGNGRCLGCYVTGRLSECCKRQLRPLETGLGWCVDGRKRPLAGPLTCWLHGEFWFQLFALRQHLTVCSIVQEPLSTFKTKIEKWLDADCKKCEADVKSGKVGCIDNCMPPDEVLDAPDL